MTGWKVCGDNGNQPSLPGGFAAAELDHGPPAGIMPLRMLSSIARAMPD
jgi:hypothetical protein